MRYFLIKSVWVLVLSFCVSALGRPASAGVAQWLLAFQSTQGSNAMGSCDVVVSGRSLCHSECEVQSKLCQRQCQDDENCMGGCTNETSVACCQKACDDKYSAASFDFDKSASGCVEQPTSAQSQIVPLPSS